MNKKFDDTYEQAAFENAVDSMLYGGTFWDWDDCGIDSQRKYIVWKVARDYVEGIQKDKPIFKEIKGAKEAITVCKGNINWLINHTEALLKQGFTNQAYFHSREVSRKILRLKKLELYLSDLESSIN